MSDNPTDSDRKDLLKTLLTQKWYNSWRNAAAWAYLLICLYDFLLAPIAIQIFIAVYHLPVSTFVWAPLTLQGGGMFHLAFGAILGVAAYGRMAENTALIGNMPNSNQQQYQYPDSPLQSVQPGQPGQPGHHTPMIF